MTYIKKAPTPMGLGPYWHYMYLLIHITTFIQSTYIQLQHIIYNTIWYNTIPAMYSKWPTNSEPNGIHCALLFLHILITLCHVYGKFPNSHISGKIQQNWVLHSFQCYNITLTHSVLSYCSFTYLIILIILLRKFPVLYTGKFPIIYYILLIPFLRKFPIII